MTELDLYSPEPTRQVADLVAWADSARAAASIAQSLVRTSFVPDAFRGKPEEATAAILSGAEVGLSPMASLRSFDIIQGSSAARAITLRAIVQAAGHRIWTEESTASRAVVCGQRRGESNVERSTWTLDRATKLKLTGKANWQNQPTAMLLARATSECARLVAADAILGIPYSSEELADLAPEPTTTVSRASDSKPKTVRRALPVAPEVEEPRLDDTPAVPEPVADEPGVIPITAAQMKRLHASMTDAGLTDREQGLAYLGAVIGRDINTSKALSKDEATRVIDELERLNTAEAATDQGDEPEEPPLDGEALWPETAQPGGAA